MKKTTNAIFLFLVTYPYVHGQDLERQPDTKSEVKPAYGDYSRWTIGAFFGFPFMSGDLSSFSSGKTYFGGSGSLVLGYQVNPLFGLDLSFETGRNKLGSPDYAENYILGPDAMTYYPPTTISGTLYSDLYSKVNFSQFGLGLSLNLNYLFTKRIPRLWMVLLQPKVYAQHFNPSVCAKGDDQEVTGSYNGKSWNIGLGGDIALRARISQYFDIQLSGDITWIENNFFDGVETVSKAKDSYMIEVKIGLIYKFQK